MRTRVAVLRGGPSGEHDVSLKTGTALLRALADSPYELHDIFIDRAGEWHRDGVPIAPERLPHIADVVLIALHGEYGEDGTLQRILERVRMPYTGSGIFPSSRAMHKAHTKDTLREAGIRVPRHTLISIEDTLPLHLLEIFRNEVPPYVVKPVTGGSSLGVSVAYTYEELGRAVAKAFEHGSQVLVEQFIPGTEATCGVVEGFRGEQLYALLPVEIVPHTGRDFFDFDAKYSGASDEICPGRFARGQSAALQHTARRVHEALGLRHYSRTDMRVTPKGEVYVLETNTLPGLTEESLVPKSLVAVGSSLPEFAEHLVGLALGR